MEMSVEQIKILNLNEDTLLVGCSDECVGQAWPKKVRIGSSFFEYEKQVVDLSEYSGVQAKGMTGFAKYKFNE